MPVTSRSKIRKRFQRGGVKMPLEDRTDIYFNTLHKFREITVAFCARTFTIEFYRLPLNFPLV